MMLRKTRNAPESAGPTRLYEALRAAQSSPAWLAGMLGVPESIVLGWCWGLDLPPEIIRQRAERFMAAMEMDTTGLWSPLIGAELKPMHLRLVPDADMDTDDHTEPKKEPKVEQLPREYPTQQELERFGVPLDALTGERPNPFDDIEDPEKVFQSPTFKALESVLWESVKKRQILVIVGAIGAGKSTLLRRAYGSARGQKQIRFMSPGTNARKNITHKTLATVILRDLIGRDTASMSQEARDDLLRSTLAAQRGVYPVLFIDEAHDLSTDALLAIKHIWDSHSMFRQLSVVLVGQPQLAERLTTDVRVRELTVRARLVELPAMDAATTRAYLDWRFARVGAKAAEVFTPAAIDLLARRGRYPQDIHTLAVRAMKLAAPTGRVVEAEHVGRA